MREAWANAETLRGEVVVNFILSEDERTGQVSKEVETHKDIAFLQARAQLLQTYEPLAMEPDTVHTLLSPAIHRSQL